MKFLEAQALLAEQREAERTAAEKEAEGGQKSKPGPSQNKVRKPRTAKKAESAPEPAAPEPPAAPSDPATADDGQVLDPIPLDPEAPPAGD